MHTVPGVDGRQVHGDAAAPVPWQRRLGPAGDGRRLQEWRDRVRRRGHRPSWNHLRSRTTHFGNKLILSNSSTFEL